MAAAFLDPALGAIPPDAPEAASALCRGAARFLDDLPSSARLVVVTSGGTTVPLEQNAFLDLGYAVLHLRRKSSAPPPPPHPKLHTIPFTTLFEYLVILQGIGVLVRPLTSRAMFYLAAAVSDYYVPWSEMPEHKIQSATRTDLTLTLRPVPKMLGLLTKEWAPHAFVVSFKLETDETILVQKATNAIASYGVHMVVANQLHTRDTKVTLVEPGAVLTTIEVETGRVDVDLCTAVARKHAAFASKELPPPS